MELVLSDEVTRRETSSADLRDCTAGVDPTMRLEARHPTSRLASLTGQQGQDLVLRLKAQLHIVLTYWPLS